MNHPCRPSACGVPHQPSFSKTSLSLIRAGALAVISLHGVSALAEHRYEALDLGAVGFSEAQALNNLGHVVGTSVAGHLLFWDGQVTTDLGVAGAVNPIATGLNSSDVIIGYTSPDNGAWRGFVYADGQFVLLGSASAAYIPSAINDAGEVAGVFYDADRTPRGVFVYRNGQTTEFTGFPAVDFRQIFVSGINRSGEIVGTLIEGMESTRARAFRLRDGVLTLLGTLLTGPEPAPGPSPRPSSFGSDIADSGTVIGITTSDVLLGLHSTNFLHTMGRMIDVTPSGAAITSTITRINNLGVAITTGRLYTNGAWENYEAKLWSGGQMLGLSALVDFSGTPFTSVFEVSNIDINDRGQILTRGHSANASSRPCLLTPRVIDQPSRLTALSARAVAGTGDQTCIAGFVLSGSASGSVLLRTVGPGLLPLGVTNAANDPALKLFNRSGEVIATNDNWSSPGADALSSTAARLGAGALIDGSADAALLANVSAGPYATHSSDATDPTDIVLTEIYDAGGDTDARLSAASIRMQIGIGESIGIVGFVISGSSPRKILIRALGPTLVGRGVPTALQNPQLWLFRGPNPVMGNDDWGSADATPLLAETTTQVGLEALPDGSNDAALLVQVEPGVYTVHVSGVGDTTGVALVELYLVP